MQKKTKAPARGASQQSTVQKPVTPADDGPAYPILEVFESHLHVKPTKGYEIVNSGELETFLIGKRRYATRQAIQRFFNKCISASLNESQVERSRKVEKAVAARARSRAETRV